jgi:CRP-like cAMP-binding protein
MLAESRPQLQNHILASLPPEEYGRLAPHLEFVELTHGKVIQEAGEHIEHIYFPEKAMVSLISQTPDGATIEVGLVGFEGMAGVSAVLGVSRSPYEMLVQVADGALRLPVAALRDEFRRAGTFHDLILRYTQALLLQTSQIAACNRLHSVLECLTRWLLMSDDRCVCEDLPFTHEFLSLMLGVRRAGVTEAAMILQTDDCIRYKRGHIQITDRKALEEHSCECYPVIKAEFDLLIAHDSRTGKH